MQVVEATRKGYGEPRGLQKVCGACVGGTGRTEF